MPNESTGFSPFELLYGRHIKGPLAVLKEKWKETSTYQNTVLSHLLDTREKMKTMAEFATENAITLLCHWWYMDHISFI